MEKPTFVYHGSCNGIEGALLPRPQRGDINGSFPEGERRVVFATHDQNLATVYTLKNKYMLNSGESTGKIFAVLRDYDAWKEDISHSVCNLYVLPANTFINTVSTKDGSPTIEWQSTVAVVPDHVIHHTPESVMQTGAQLFFLDSKVTSNMWHYQPEKPAAVSFWNRVSAKKAAGILPDSFTMFDIAKELIDAGIMRHLNAETSIRPLVLAKSRYGALIKDDIEWLKQQMLVKPEPQRADGKPWANSLGKRSGRIIT
jgi:hypothetical protein